MCLHLITTGCCRRGITSEKNSAKAPLICLDTCVTISLQNSRKVVVAIVRKIHWIYRLSLLEDKKKVATGSWEAGRFSNNICQISNNVPWLLTFQQLSVQHVGYVKIKRVSRHKRWSFFLKERQFIFIVQMIYTVISISPVWNTPLVRSKQDLNTLTTSQTLTQLSYEVEQHKRHRQEVPAVPGCLNVVSLLVPLEPHADAILQEGADETQACQVGQVLFCYPQELQQHRGGEKKGRQEARVTNEKQASRKTVQPKKMQSRLSSAQLTKLNKWVMNLHAFQLEQRE